MQTYTKYRKIAFILVVIMLISAASAAFAVKAEFSRTSGQVVRVTNIDTGNITLELKTAIRAYLPYSVTESKNHKEKGDDGKYHYYTWYTGAKCGEYGCDLKEIGVSGSISYTKDKSRFKVGKDDTLHKVTVTLDKYTISYKYKTTGSKNNNGEYFWGTNTESATGENHGSKTYNKKLEK